MYGKMPRNQQKYLRKRNGKKKKNQLLYIEIVNAAKNTGIQTDENFVSKKKDGVLHGYGMKNIRDIVEQYNGMFQCKSQEDRFEVVITIYG